MSENRPITGPNYASWARDIAAQQDHLHERFDQFGQRLNDTAEALADERRERVFGVAVRLLVAVCEGSCHTLEKLDARWVDKAGEKAEMIVRRLWDKEPTPTPPPPTRPDVAEACCCEQEQAEQLAGDAA